MPPHNCNTLAKHSCPCLCTCVEHDPGIRMSIRSLSVRERGREGGLNYSLNTLCLKIAMTRHAFDVCLFIVEPCLVYLSSVSSIIDKACLQLSGVTVHMASSVTSLITCSVDGAEHHGTCSHCVIHYVLVFIINTLVFCLVSTNKSCSSLLVLEIWSATKTFYPDRFKFSIY